MTKNDAMGIIFANMHDQNLPQITANRSMASVPFAGRYRLIDFVLSDMANAGIHNIGVVVRQNYQSLMDHLGNGREWDLSRKRGGLVIFPPFGRVADKIYQNRIESLYNVMSYLTYCKEELVVMSDCDVVRGIDFTELIAKHRAANADVTVVYERSPIPEGLLEDNTTYTLGEDGFVTEIRNNDYQNGNQNLSMSTYVIGRELLIRLIRDAMVRGLMLFEKDILSRSLKALRVFAYRYTGYRARICDMRTYYHENLRLIKKENLAALFPEELPVYTKVRDGAPVRYAIGSKVTNSIVADGCIIEGELDNCVLFREVRVAKGAVLKNCIIMQGAEIQSGARLENVVTDKNVVIGMNKELCGDKNFPVFIQKGVRVE